MLDLNKPLPQSPTASTASSSSMSSLSNYSIRFEVDVPRAQHDSVSSVRVESVKPESDCFAPHRSNNTASSLSSALDTDHFIDHIMAFPRDNEEHRDNIGDYISTNYGDLEERPVIHHPRVPRPWRSERTVKSMSRLFSRLRFRKEAKPIRHTRPSPPPKPSRPPRHLCPSPPYNPDNMRCAQTAVSTSGQPITHASDERGAPEISITRHSAGSYINLLDQQSPYSPRRRRAQGYAVGQLDEVPEEASIQQFFDGATHPQQMSERHEQLLSNPRLAPRVSMTQTPRASGCSLATGVSHIGGPPVESEQHEGLGDRIKGMGNRMREHYGSAWDESYEERLRNAERVIASYSASDLTRDQDESHVKDTDHDAGDTDDKASDYGNNSDDFVPAPLRKSDSSFGANDDQRDKKQVGGFQRLNTTDNNCASSNSPASPIYDPRVLAWSTFGSSLFNPPVTDLEDVEGHYISRTPSPLLPPSPQSPTNYSSLVSSPLLGSKHDDLRHPAWI